MNYTAMKKIIFIIFVLTPFLLIYQAAKSQTPRWVKNPPTKDGMYVAIGSGSSTQADVAKRKAMLDAHVNLAKQAEPEITTETTRLVSALSNKPSLESRVKVIRKTVTANLRDVRTIKQKASERKGIHTVYVLVEMPKNSVSRAIVEEINNDDELKKALANSDVYKQIATKAK